MTITTNTFYAKIILFGEYGIIFDGMALTIPFAHVQGQLKLANKYSFTNLDLAKKSTLQLRKFADYIQEKQQVNIFIDNDKFKSDLEKGLYFESTIPQGYGLGSSGAICAAVYSRYGLNKIPSHRTIETKDILALKNAFSEMESFFHGKSSGIDPLNSYIKYPILFRDPSHICVVNIPRNKEIKDSAIFLINTKQPGKTEPLVHLFLEKINDNEDYKEQIDNSYIPLSNNCIEDLLSGKIDGFFDNLKQLSRFQLEYLNPMIPYKFQMQWKNGIKSDDYYLKLCGSGGGGYLLGFTRNFQKVKKYFKEQKIELITVYQNG